jgi:hypothetical protein
MQSTIGRTLAAGSAVVLFVIAVIAFAMNADRIAGGAALAGMALLSLAILAHVSDQSRR